jgi:hypothetical protein
MKFNKRKKRLFRLVVFDLVMISIAIIAISASPCDETIEGSCIATRTPISTIGLVAVLLYIVSPTYLFW